jgi:Tol biopolymer transport system component
VFGAHDSHDLVIREIASGRERTVFHDGSGEIDGVAFSRDGKRIAFVYSAGNAAEIRVINASGGAARTVLAASPGIRNLHDWSPDGSKVLVYRWSRGEFRLFWLNVNDGTQTTLVEGRGLPIEIGAAISPDGRLVVFGGPRDFLQTSDSGGKIHVIGSDGRGEQVLSSVATDLYPVGWTSDGRAALIVSHRSNTVGLWAFPVSNGVAAGEPREIERDLCSCDELRASAFLGTTRRGDLYFQTSRTHSDIYTARLDPATGRASAAAVAVNTSRKGSNGRPIWSPDGKRLLFIWDTPNHRELVTFTVDNGVEQRFPRIPLDTFGVCWAGSNAFLYRRASSDNTLPMPGTADVEFRRYDLLSGRDQLLFQDAASFFSCSADGTTVAYRSVPRPADGTPRDFLSTRNLVSGTTSKREFPENTNLVTKLSPRGDELAFFEIDAPPLAPGRVLTGNDLRARATASWRLLIVPTAGGTAREIARAAAGESFQIGGGNEGVAWSADGRFVYYAKQHARGDDFEIFRVPTAGGPEERVGLAGPDLRELSVSPDGSRIAFAMGLMDSPEIWAVENISVK